MATTPHGIPLVDGTSEVQPIQTPLNAMADALDNALDEVLDQASEAQGYYLGTNDQRLALAAPKLRNGITWFATDTNVVWERRSSVWVPRSPIAMAAGSATTSASGTATVALPAGRFSVPPIIQVTSTSGRIATVSAKSATSFNAIQADSTGAGKAGTFDWTAIQMTPTTAAG